MLRAHKIDLKNFPRQNGLGKCFFIIINNGSEPKEKICFFPKRSEEDLSSSSAHQNVWRWLLLQLFVVVGSAGANLKT